MKISFLSASLPLTKRISMVGNKLHKEPYPHVFNFTSNPMECGTIGEFYKILHAAAHAPAKPCLLKGELQRPLKDESRKGSTNANSPTQWACFDLDGAPFSTPDEFMRSVKLEDVSYIVQYSSSYKINPKDKRLSCHIFVMTEKALPAPQLKAWLMDLNFSVPVLEKALELSKAAHALHWPLDVTACQNDKLIYIGAPVFEGMKDPLKPDERLKLVTRPLAHVPYDRIELKAMETLKKVQREKLNALRSAAGLSPLRAKIKMVGEYEVQTGVGEASSYECFDCGEYVRLNVNGGDSRAYWYGKGNHELLHNFKGEPSVPLKELLPGLYAELEGKNAVVAAATKVSEKKVLLAFRDKVTARYWKGTWNPEDFKLDLHAVKSELQLDHFLQEHGRSLGAFIPEWSQVFDPTLDFVVDEDNKVINLFIPTEHMRLAKTYKAGTYPTIQRIIDSAVGIGATQEHFLNWLACIVQFRCKTDSAWVLHGTQGTGKDKLIDAVLIPILGHQYVVKKRASELKSQFTSYLEHALVVFINEIDVDIFENPNAIESELKDLITGRTASIRRMYQDTFSVPSFCNFIFASNKPQPVKIPGNDRRFNVGQRGTERLYFTDKELTSDGLVSEKEVRAFAQYLATREASLDKARSILQSADRDEMQALSITSVDTLAGDILSGNLMMLWDSMPDEKLRDRIGSTDIVATAYVQMMYRFVQEDVSRISRDELAIIFEHCIGKVPEGAHKQSLFFRHHGIVLERMRIDGLLTPAVEVRWEIKATDKKEMLAQIPNAKPKMIRSVK